MIEEEIVEPGLCPYCNSPTDYTYHIEGPIMNDNEAYVEIKYKINCKSCGYSNSKSLYIPLNSFYLLKYMLTPKARIVLEKIKIVSDIKVVEKTS
ncbi:hypothetical protein Calag_1538 [Caldisphaera lagunensis DSM 15908]|uniref:Uncharacterized protein n=1 Tax=Caldisphaera lagunensis (strain DSM 15908 / JCM 11604 / ANMR 0165 / IC-154) TaxID=1056495 RepID=L0ABJ7_CALLD|nr:hypothetical protein [Caldisphaera lagunensis]AFZ71236.1 hypothetical protein Calag_1538 [Caldisphaera lagunensis DSM 15908]